MSAFLHLLGVGSRSSRRQRGHQSLKHELAAPIFIFFFFAMSRLGDYWSVTFQSNLCRLLLFFHMFWFERCFQLFACGLSLQVNAYLVPFNLISDFCIGLNCPLPHCGA